MRAIRTVPLLVLLSVLGVNPSSQADVNTSAPVAQAAPAPQPTPVSVTLLHTNDLHSHFRSERTALQLGGVARLKTAISALRTTVPNTLLIDGGDWSEGSAYYTVGAGSGTLEIMDRLGYDVAVVGNHDWLNGPDTLLDAIGRAAPSFTLVMGNAVLDGYDRAAEYLAKIPPYAIREKGGVKIAFIGMGNAEALYARYLGDVAVSEPAMATAALAAELKPLVDAIVVVSHNAIDVNRGILEKNPDVDLVIGAHDHARLLEPVRVNRADGSQGWVVEAGCWGQYLGRVDLKVTPRAAARAAGRRSVELVSYGLQQIDLTTPEDPDMTARVDALEAVIEGKMGPIFHDAIGESRIEIDRAGFDNVMGDFVTDAYREATGADLALDNIAFIYDGIHEGPVRLADVFNAMPAIYDPKEGKAWKLQTLGVTGARIRSIFNLLFSSHAASMFSNLAVSGLQLTYDSTLEADTFSIQSLVTPGTDSLNLNFRSPAVLSLSIGGQPLDPDKVYKVAMSGGIATALQEINEVFAHAFPLDSLVDTKQESWRVVADSLKAKTPILSSTVKSGNRIQTRQADAGILTSGLQWEPLAPESDGVVHAKVSVRIANTGASPMAAGQWVLHLLANRNGINRAVPEDLRAVAPDQPVPALAPGESTLLSWADVAVPAAHGVAPLTAAVYGPPGSETEYENNLVTRVFKAPAPAARP